MSIHSEHPFTPAEGDRDPLRRLRGRLAAPVTVWTTWGAGLTISSVLVADGEPSRVLGLVDEDSELWEAEPETVVVNVLGAEHRYLAEAFAGTAPAPGGPFTLGTWTESDWGPVLDGAAGWLGVRLEPDARHVGWRVLVEGVVEHVEIGAVDPLVLLRGRQLDSTGLLSDG